MMTGGLLCIPGMRPNPCWTLLPASVLAVLVLTLNADSKDSGCSFEIRVRRDTQYEGFLGQDLTIECPVVATCNETPSVSWMTVDPSVPVNVSSHIQTSWEWTVGLNGTSYLTFRKMLCNDSGLYQCTVEHDVGHSINVTVRDSDPEPQDQIWMYAYSAAGIGAFVAIVIVVTVMAMQGCKGKSKKETGSENQYTGLPMVQPHFPRDDLQPPQHPRESTSPRDGAPSYAKVTGGRERARLAATTAAEGSSVVYAALNHQLPAAPTTRPRRPLDEISEYAAIRVP